MGPRNDPRSRGGRAERLAAAYLEWAGLIILDRNRAAAGGEIDLLARDGSALVFVEVRARGPGSWTTAAGSLTPDKRRRLRRCARELARRPDWRWPGRSLRFDLVTVGPAEGGVLVRHLRGIDLHGH